MEKETLTAREVYGDIIDLPHHQSETHRHMSLYDRAAQFAPFAALSGYDDMVKEEARLTDSEIELSDGALDVLNEKIGLITQQIASGCYPIASFIHFEPDKFKSGGKYVTTAGVVKKVDAISGLVFLFPDDPNRTKNTQPVKIQLSRVIAIDLDNEGEIAE